MVHGGGSLWELRDNNLCVWVHKLEALGLIEGWDLFGVLVENIR